MTFIVTLVTRRAPQCGDDRARPGPRRTEDEQRPLRRIRARSGKNCPADVRSPRQHSFMAAIVTDMNFEFGEDQRTSAAVIEFNGKSVAAAEVLPKAIHCRATDFQIS